MKTLVVYPNCSKGGVTSVLRARALNRPRDFFDFVFLNDRGGLGAFTDLENTNVRIVRSDRVESYLRYIAGTQEYEEIRVLSAPHLANAVSADDNNSVIYEFHSSDMGVVEQEIKQLELDKLAEIVVPSSEMKSWITPRLRKRIRYRLRVEENLVDTKNFNLIPKTDFLLNYSLAGNTCPVVWVGRFDAGKGINYLPRIIRQLPENYIAYVVVSLEQDSERAGSFLYECDAMGVGERVKLLMNLSSAELGDLYRSAASRGGWYISTSLMESYGYAVREAAACGLKVAAFELPVFDSLTSERFITAPTGDVISLASAINNADSGRES